MRNRAGSPSALNRLATWSNNSVVSLAIVCLSADRSGRRLFVHGETGRAPFVEATRKVEHVGHASRLKQARRDRGASSALAVHDDWLLPRHGARLARQVSKWNVVGAGDVTGLPL